MESYANYRMVLRPRSELTTGLVLYGENEPAEMQIENLWKIVDCRTVEELVEPRIDFSEFSMGDKLYPSMMKPEAKRRWDQKQYAQEEAKATFAKLKRMIHAKFMEQNPNLPVVQGLAETEYGRKVTAEFIAAKASFKLKYSQQQGQHPYAQTGTGDSIQDELANDGIEVGSDEKVRTIAFKVPGADNPFTVLATARDEKLRIVERLLALEPNDLHFQYGYDAGGRLNMVWQGERVVEQYQYGEQGERLVSETLHFDLKHYEYNDKLRLLKSGDTTYTYNAYGSLADKKVKNRITKYEYLSNGQLYKVVLPDGRIIEYVCDKRGVRTAKKVNGKIIEKYKWKDFSTLEAITDGKGQNKITFKREEESCRIVMTSEGKKYYLAVDQVGSVFMVADSQGNEVKRIIYDSFGNILVDTNEQFYLPLCFASGLTDKDTGLIHFGFREYDPEIGRFTAPDPLGYGGGDVDVYGYCLDDPINFNDPLGLMTGGIWGNMPRRHNVQIWYIWRANEGSCAACRAKNNEVAETPTMKRPHPNCRCEQVKCQIWDEYTEWEEAKRLWNGPAKHSIPIFPKGTTQVRILWSRRIKVQESRTVRHYRMMESKIELLYTKQEVIENTKWEKATGWAYTLNTNYGVETGDIWYAKNPWTGEQVGGSR